MEDRSPRLRLEDPGGPPLRRRPGLRQEAPEAQTIGPRSVPILILTSVVAVKWRRADGEEPYEEYGVVIKF